MKRQPGFEEFRKLVLRVPKSRPLRYYVDPPGTPITLWEGPVTLSSDATRVSASGSVLFSWLPSPSLTFEGRAALPFSSNPLGAYQFQIPKRSTKAAIHLSGVTFGTRPTTAKGFINHGLILGTPKPVEALEFHLVNFAQFSGGRVRSGPQSETFLHTGRTALTSGAWRLLIDQRHDIRDIEDSLSLNGGFATTHIVRAEKADGTLISFEEAKEFLSACHCFLALLRGFWCGPVIPAGIVGGRRVWTEWGPWKLTPYKHVGTWLPLEASIHLSDAFAGFMARWNDPDWNSPIRLATHWYVDANMGGSAVETSLVLSQVALELLGWVHLVETTTTYSRSSFEPMKAAEKIGALLNSLDIPTTIPAEYEALNAVAASEGYVDGPWAFTSLRNGLVHPRAGKRALIDRSDGLARFEAAQLALGYIELTMLALFLYRGKYQRRVFGTHRWQATVNVPWQKSP